MKGRGLLDSKSLELLDAQGWSIGTSYLDMRYNYLVGTEMHNFKLRSHESLDQTRSQDVVSFTLIQSHQHRNSRHIYKDETVSAVIGDQPDAGH